MAELAIEKSAERLRLEQTLRVRADDYLSRPASPRSGIYRQDPNLSEVMNAYWRTHTVIGTAQSYLKEQAVIGDEGPIEGFNPITYFADNRKDYADMEQFVLDGVFDSIRGPNAFDARVNSIRQEFVNRDIIERGSTLGDVLGMGAAMLDISTFVPLVGWAAKAGLLAKTLRTGLQTGAVVGIEEAVMHQQQRTRTFYESYMSVAASTVFGSSLGLAGALITRKGKPLHKDHPENPLAEKNLSKTDEPHYDDYDPINGLSQSEHIAKYVGDEIKYTPERGVTFTRGKVSRAVDAMQDFIGFTRTIEGVKARTKSSITRDVLSRLTETNLHIKEIENGTIPSRRQTAEMWKETSVLAPRQVAERRIIDSWYGLMGEWGHGREFITKMRSDISEVKGFVKGVRNATQPETAAAQRAMGEMTLPQFHELVYKVASGIPSQKRYRVRGNQVVSGGTVTMKVHANPLVDKYVKQAIEGPDGLKAFFSQMQKRLVRSGLLKEGQEIENYVPQIWIADAIIENPLKLKAFFMKKFAARFKDKPEKLDEFAERLVERLSDRYDETIPFGFWSLSDKKATLGKAGSLERRDLHLSPEELDEVSEFLDTDLSRLTMHYSDRVGGKLVLREMFGAVEEADIETVVVRSPEGLKVEQPMDELSMVIKDVRKEYKELKRAARRKGQNVSKLTTDQIISEKAIANAMQRITGQDRIPSAEHWGTFALYAGRMMRKLNFLRAMGGVHLSSQTDYATLALSTGIGPHLKAFGQNMGKIAKTAKDLNNKELAYLIFGTEGAASLSRQAKMMGVDDAHYMLGFGSGATRKVSAGLEAGANWASNQMNIANLMYYHNSRGKFINGMVVMGNILDDAASLAAGKASKYKWRELGLSDEVMVRIHRLTQKHGFEVNRVGHTFRIPDVEKWMKEAGGYQAKIALHTALKRESDRAIVTPTIADIPIFQSQALGQLLFQFNAFGFSSTNKYLRRLDHKAMNGQGLEVALNVSMALSLGTMIFALREGIVKGRFYNDTMPKDEATWVYEAIDRSGFIGWLAPYLNSFMKLTAQPMSELGVPIEPPSRFAAQNWVGPLLGPTFGGGLGDLEAMGSNLAAGEMEKVYTKTKRFAPFGNIYYVDTLLNIGEAFD